MIFHLTEDGKVTKVSYQTLIRALHIEEEVVHGRPLTAGGAPQGLTVKGLVEKAWPNVQVEVFVGGGQIF